MQPFPTVRYLAAPLIGYRFKTSSLPVAGLGLYWVAGFVRNGWRDNCAVRYAATSAVTACIGNQRRYLLGAGSDCIAEE